MTLSELIAELVKIAEEVGLDSHVFLGSYYKDIGIDSVVIEDGYPLILIEGYEDKPVHIF
jgi:hypothetical protein